jgi:hypothetical protein
MTSSVVVARALKALLDSQRLIGASTQLCSQCCQSQAQLLRQFHTHSSACCAPALQPVQAHEQAELTWWQHRRVKSILRQRERVEAKSSRCFAHAQRICRKNLSYNSSASQVELKAHRDLVQIVFKC